MYLGVDSLEPPGRTVGHGAGAVHRVYQEVRQRSYYVSLDEGYLGAIDTRRNRSRPNLAAPTWPLNSCASTCAGAIPARPASRSGCSTCPSNQNAEFTHEKTAEYVEAG